MSKYRNNPFITEMINNGRIAVSEAAADEFNDELDEEQPSEDEGMGFGDQVAQNSSGGNEDGTTEVDEEDFMNTDFSNDGMGNNNFEDEYEEPEPEPEPVEKIHTIDTISQITNRFDQNMAHIGFDWDPFI